MYVRAAGKPQNPKESSTGHPFGKTLSARHRSPSPIPWREQLYKHRRATQNSASHFSRTPLCDCCVAATAPSSSDNFHLCDYPHIATDVPTPSDAMSLSDDFPDIHDFITTKFMYLPLQICSCSSLIRFWFMYICHVIVVIQYVTCTYFC